MGEDILSQEELDALLEGGIDDLVEDDEGENESILTEVEIDALGEIGNISMGTSATTLSTLLDKKVSITTPEVSITDAQTLADDYEYPLVAIDVKYKAGLEGTNIMVLKTDDAKIITDLMMGKDEVDTSRELNDMDLSAVSEAMNQMMGSSATSLSEMLNKKIDIEPPEAEVIVLSEDINKFSMLKNADSILKISFKMNVEGYIDSNIMQLVPVEFGKEIVECLMEPMGDEEIIVKDQSKAEEDSKEVELEQAVEEKSDKKSEEEIEIKKDKEIEGVKKPELALEQEKIIDEEVGQTTYERPVEKVMVDKPSFKSFDSVESKKPGVEIDLVGDIPVEITVELGRTERKIGEILEFRVGTVVELDKLVGEPLNIYANGKYIARGEVVVIDDSFGIRVTDIDGQTKNII